MKLDEDAGLPLVFREMQRMHRSRLQRVLNEYGLYMGQPMILFALERIPDATQKELADALHISSATITTSLQRMERAGLLTRTTDPRDTRCNHIVLTDKGRHVSSECHAAFAHMDEVMGNRAAEDGRGVRWKKSEQTAGRWTSCSCIAGSPTR